MFKLSENLNNLSNVKTHEEKIKHTDQIKLNNI